MHTIIHHKSIKLVGDSYKAGLNEVQGLEQAMRAALVPVRDYMRESMYWNSDIDFESSEYKSRDGFIAHPHNCGGLEMVAIIPKVESYDWDILEFGECDECQAGDGNRCGYEGQECGNESEGYLDANLRIWFKFEGFENGEMKFYLYAGGGNQDAPYFRVKYEPTLFERDFTAKTITEFSRKANRHVKSLLKFLKGE